MRILAIDTATEACSVALLNDGAVSAHFEECPREHTQRILPLVKAILTQGNTSLTDLDALAFGRGPGSFTGVRIGIGIAQGLALGVVEAINGAHDAGRLDGVGIGTAQVLGAGPWRVLASIDVALAARGLGLAAGFAFATSLGEFGATSFLARPDQPTLPVMVFRLIGRPGLESQGMAMAAAVVLALGCAIVMGIAETLRPKEARLW